ncbi:YbaB/EbfC family nucleoid-associated protein [Facklamia sp. 7083-14-GEN3]|uniref:YbaB/EbfC family nucleoid-associated protein n=1 Tax=Facklamia sp. 7083-14-GEN3 TaxID=2973478 RepID=UPI00215B8999|nr:YbaB/EbfC family nucleoid-associated protein [Facklamia sp. 7083-14-GEN3]MCR8969929.1 YbaB/EbfC family nucleoid-associated protein [Facklamia sp. 7083-14-GEN3]
MPNMNNMMKQVQKMQKEMEKTQKELETKEFVVEDAQKLVKVVMTGKKEIKELTIKPDLVDPEDIEMLQDVVLATVNQAIQEVEQTTQDQMGQFTKGLNLPF